MYPINIQLISKEDILIISLDIQMISTQDILFISRCYQIGYPRMISNRYPYLYTRYPWVSQAIHPNFIFPVWPSCHSRWGLLCAPVSTTLGQLAHLWPHWTTFVRARPPLRQVRLLSRYPRWPVSLPLQMGCCHGPVALLTSTRPVWWPACRVSASGDCFWRRCATCKTSESDVKVAKGSMWAHGFVLLRWVRLCAPV
jgi:hypothetical protein